VGKLPVVVRDSPGFLVNRVLFPYLLEAADLYQSGVAPQEIDEALVRWGMPMGPLRLIDEISVDITVDIAETLERAFGDRDRAPEVLRKMQAAKMLGRKTGSGFYKYEGKQHTPNDALKIWPSTDSHSERSEVERNAGGTVTQPPPRMKSPSRDESLMEAQRDPSTPNAFEDDRTDAARGELANRLVFLMVNEAARCLDEKVVATPADADYGMTLGTGFPPHRGGPLRFAEHYGLKKLVAEMDGLLSRAGEKFAPCDLLRQHAQNGTTFYEA
jgi:3-hydroxyacyl-CoA dehydrogenase/enoyl-CoA hydratase/3-hydroxybutyryl-CoA epimerase